MKILKDPDKNIEELSLQIFEGLGNDIILKLWLRSLIG